MPSEVYTDWLEVIKWVHITQFQATYFTFVHPSQEIYFSGWVDVVRWRLKIAITVSGCITMELQEEAVEVPSIDTSITWQLRGMPPFRHQQDLYLQPGNIPQHGMSYSIEGEYDDAEMVGTINAQSGHYVAPARIDLGPPCHCLPAGLTPQHGVPLGGIYSALVYAIPTVLTDAYKVYPEKQPAGLPYAAGMTVFQPW